MLESRFVVYNHYEPPIDYTDDDEIRNVSDRDSDDDDVRRENEYNDGDNHFDRENYSNIHNNFDDFDDEEGEEEEDSRGSCSSRSRKSSQRYQATLDRRTRPHQKSHPSKTSMKFPLPTIDFRNLTFDRPIGQGGFSRVYRGRWNNDIMVAIKEPFYYSHNSISLINRAILEEARLHLHLNHPNIIKLYGISINAHRLYLIMEYAHGRSLRELLSQRSLTPNLIIKFAIQISSAMEYLHSLRPKPIIHRDLKSLNILLNRPITDDDWSYKQIKLTDLGLAREFSGSAQSMMTQCGTYAWMAPESITESKFSKASDVWSFGVVLWELLTGQIPYRNVSGAAVAFGIGNRKLTLPIPESCPDELKRILKSCWQQSPNQRPNFRTIRLDLEKSSFNVINKEKFEKMKRIWFEEIETIWKGLKLKEKELEFREYKARMKEAEAKEKEREIERMKKFLLKQSDELKRREIEVVGRELNVLLHQQQQQQQTNDNNKPIKGKRKREKRLITKKNFLQNNSDEVRGGDPVIGYPKNFCHNLTIRNASPETNQSQISLQAKALNQTWTPGTKIRPELNVNLFSNSQLNSRELREFYMINSLGF
ncbi:ataxin-10-like [Sarcoptes scabiei]|nr:ataxin-10-like [Sarcoptes scabiei]